MAGKEDEIRFRPINQDSPGSRIALTIRPPGAWFGNRDFVVLVGGCGNGRRKTLAEAKALLLELALDQIDRRIADARSEIQHYEAERKKLSRGLVLDKSPKGPS